MCPKHFNSEPLNVLGSLNVVRRKPNVLKLSKCAGGGLPKQRRGEEEEEEEEGLGPRQAGWPV